MLKGGFMMSTVLYNICIKWESMLIIAIIISKKGSINDNIVYSTAHKQA